MTTNDIKEFVKKYSENTISYGIGQCYIESIWIENDKLVSKLSTSGSFGAPYYVRGYLNRSQIESDLIRIFIK